MKNTVLILATVILAVTSTALADSKIKIRQTSSGQTTENTTYIKGKRERTEMMGGVMVSITQCDLGRDIRMNPSAKTYTISYYDDGNGNITPASSNSGTSAASTKGGTMYVTTTIKDTGERRQMFGYTARHIIQTVETDTSPDACYPSKTKMEMDMWVIDAEFGMPCTQTRQYQPNGGAKAGGCVDKVVPKTIGTAKSGYPLIQKMTSFDANGKESFTMTQEVVEMSKATLDAELFDVPADYREVKDATQLYAAGVSSGVSYTGPSTSSTNASTGLSSTIKAAAEPKNNASSVVSTKAPGAIRVGLATVKTGAVGENVNAAELAAAIQNSLGEYLKGTKVEIVPLEAKLASAISGEAREKECDFILSANVSHKKGGGGGFGFGKVLGQVVSQTGIGHTGSAIGNIAGQMATTAIVTAGSMSGNVKSKDEVTLDVRLQSMADNSSPLAKQFKVKAKSDGDDIISAVVEQAAEAIVNAIGN